MPLALNFAPLEQFLLQRYPTNAWLSIGSYEVYVRKGYHNIPKLGACHTLDLGNVVNRANVYAGFWRLFAKLQELGQQHSFNALYLENTHNDRLRTAYLERGCTLIPGTHDLYKLLPSKDTQPCKNFSATAAAIK